MTLDDLPRYDEFTGGASGVDHPDLRLLPKIEQALLYRRSIKAGDPIPSELTTGRPSWWVPRDVAMRASARVMMQMAPRLRSPHLPWGSPQEAAELIGSEITNTILSVEDAIMRAQSTIDAIGWYLEVREQITRATHMVSEIAAEVKRTPIPPQENPLRLSGRRLRTLMTWVVNWAMGLDGKCGSAAALFDSHQLISQVLWPRINALRAWAIDIEPVVQYWSHVRKPESRSMSHLDMFNRLVAIRFGDGFVPDSYTNARRSSDTHICSVPADVRNDESKAGDDSATTLSPRLLTV